MTLFEKRARDIFRNLNPYQTRGIIDPTTGRADRESSLRLRNAAFASAQKLIISELQSITTKEKSIKAQAKEARKIRNRSQESSLKRELAQVEYKEVIIRKLADSIAWQVIGGRNDIAQWLHEYEKSPSIDESNLESVMDQAETMNQGNPLSFALISDLTSFIRIGDIIKRDTSGILHIIEVKEGKANQKAIAIIQDELLAEEDNLDLPRLESTHGSHLAKQIRRIHKQLRKGARVEEIINTGKGKDPKTDTEVIIREPLRAPASYTLTFAKLLIELDTKDWAYTIVENGLMVGCYKGSMKVAGRSILTSLAQASFQRNFVTTNFRLGLATPLAEPVFLKPFREDDIFDIVFDRTRVFFVLDLDWLVEAFRERGTSARWLSQKETMRLRQQHKYERLFEFNGRAIALENAEWSLLIGEALHRRILFDNLLPSSVVSMLKESLDSPPTVD
jgi:hypothetical protein